MKTLRSFGIREDEDSRFNSVKLFTDGYNFYIRYRYTPMKSYKEQIYSDYLLAYYNFNKLVMLLLSK